MAFSILYINVASFCGSRLCIPTTSLRRQLPTEQGAQPMPYSSRTRPTSGWAVISSFISLFNTFCNKTLLLPTVLIVTKLKSYPRQNYSDKYIFCQAKKPCQKYFSL